MDNVMDKGYCNLKMKEMTKKKKYHTVRKVLKSNLIKNNN